MLAFEIPRRLPYFPLTQNPGVQKLPMEIMKLWKIFKYLVRVYAVALPKIFSGLFNIFNPKSILIFVQNVLNVDDFQKPCPHLGSIDIIEKFNLPPCDVQIIGQYYDDRLSCGATNVLKELSILAFVCKAVQPDIIFEFGTFVGATTRLFALNSPATAKIYTLDLPENQVPHDVGSQFRSTQEEGKIIMLSGDSKSFDFSGWIGKCDLVWVDGCHTYECVVSDSANAFKIVKPDGWILWHDYRHSARWSGVTRHLRELKRQYPGISHVKGTTVAVLKMGQ